MRLTVNSKPTLDSLISTVTDQWEKHKYVQVEITPGKHRTLDANALSHVWYAKISRELGEGSPEDIHCECKLRWGVPILRAENEDFRKRYDHYVKGHSYEDKLEIMRLIPVTSLMTTDQMRRYLEEVQRAYAKRGVVLENR